MQIYKTLSNNFQKNAQQNSNYTLFEIKKNDIV